MRVNCKFYESRTYKSGDTVRQCRLDLAPEAPWRCPENCPSFQLKLVDSGWTHGSLAPPPLGDEPALDADHIAMLDAAEDLLHSIGPEIINEVQLEREMDRRRQAGRKASRKRWWWPF